MCWGLCQIWSLDADIPLKLAISGCLLMGGATGFSQVSQGSADTSLILWDLERLECLRTFEGRAHESSHEKLGSSARAHGSGVLRICLLRPQVGGQRLR